jgi:hypothetical protein
MPDDQEATIDGTEAEHLEWVRPADGLARWDAGDYVMLPPTVGALKQLARQPSAHAMRAAHADPVAPWAAVKIVGDERGRFSVFLPGDRGYDDAISRTDNGWVRVVR